MQPAVASGSAALTAAAWKRKKSSGAAAAVNAVTKSCHAFATPTAKK
jgi:hypothetical protein